MPAVVRVAGTCTRTILFSTIPVSGMRATYAVGVVVGTSARRKRAQSCGREGEAVSLYDPPTEDDLHKLFTRATGRTALEAQIERLGYLADDNQRLRRLIAEFIVAARADVNLRGFWCWLEGVEPESFWKDVETQRRVYDALKALEAEVVREG